jgi:hypothetical protein
VLLHRGLDRHRAQYFATTDWPGYPVVNPTMLGSKSASALASAWAFITVLGHSGFADLARECMAATAALRACIDGIDGLRIVGDPAGPLIAVATDETVPAQRRTDPHRWADAVREAGWVLQQQPGYVQSNGERLPHTTHLTVTPVTLGALEELAPALVAAATAVRGLPSVDAGALLAGLAPGGVDGGEGADPAVMLGALADAAAAGALDSQTAAGLLGALGLGGVGPAATGAAAMPEQMASLLAAIEALPHPLVERLLTELLARYVQPR